MYPRNFLSQDNGNFLYCSEDLQRDLSKFLMERRFLYRNVNQYFSLHELLLSYVNLNISTPLYNGLIANFFFLYYFTGKKPFFLPVKIISTFKTKVYNFQCYVRLTKKDSCSFLLKQISFASKILTSNDFGVYAHSLSNKEFSFFLKNFPYLRLVETHPVFFKWNESLNVQVKFRQFINFAEIKDFCCMLKIDKNVLSF